MSRGVAGKEDMHLLQAVPLRKVFCHISTHLHPQAPSTLRCWQPERPAGTTGPP